MPSYDFPNVNITETIVGPLPLDTTWRNTIGVAGQFSRGPSEPTLISSRQEFAQTFGEDLSPGSVFVRQAMLQGATNFMISRVIPRAAAAAGSFSFSHPSQPGSSEAFIGTNNADRTLALRFEAAYTGPAVQAAGNYVGADVAVKNQVMTMAYDGKGYFDFEVIERVLTSETASSAFSAAVTVTTSDQPQVIIVTAQRAKVKPGKIITSAANSLSLTVESYPWESAPGVWSAIVRGAVGTAVTANDLIVGVPAADYYVVGYRYRSDDGSILPNSAVAERVFSVGAGTKTLTGFVTYAASSPVYKQLRLFADVVTAANRTVDTGVEINFTNADASTTLRLNTGARFTVPIVRGIAEIGSFAATGPDYTGALPAGATGLEIMRQLRGAVLSDNSLSVLISNATINDSDLPLTLTFSSAFNGDGANRIYYKLTRHGTATDITITPTVTTAMSGGNSGIVPAGRYYYDINGNPLVFIQAISPGVSGNSLEISIRPEENGKFRLQVSDTSAYGDDWARQPEAFILSNYNVDRQTGAYVETLGSNLIRAYFLPARASLGGPVLPELLQKVPMRLAPSLGSYGTGDTAPDSKGTSYLAKRKLQGGKDASSVSSNLLERDMVNAIAALEQEDCAFIACPGAVLGDVRYEAAVSALVTQAEQSTTVNGRRFALIEVPARLSDSLAEQLGGVLNSPRVIRVGGWTTFLGMQALGTFNVSPLGIYAGYVAMIPPHVSPASINQTGRGVEGVLQVDTNNSPPSLDAITRARTELLFYDPGLRMFKFLNGVTTSTDPNHRWVCVRRAMDQLITDLYLGLQWVRSRPNDAETRKRVATSIDAYLKAALRDGRIYGYRATVCDQSNNTLTDVRRGRLNIKITVTPVFPSDFIDVEVVRDLTDELTLITSPN